MMLVFIFAFGKTLHPASALIFPIFGQLSKWGTALIKQNSPKEALSRRFYEKTNDETFLDFQTNGGRTQCNGIAKEKKTSSLITCHQSLEILHQRMPETQSMSIDRNTS